MKIYLIDILSLWGTMFSHTRMCHWYVEKSDIHVLQRKYVSSLYRSIFFKFAFLLTKSYFFFGCLYNILVGFNTFSWVFWAEKGGGGAHKKKFQVTKLEALMLFYKQRLLNLFYPDKIVWDNSLCNNKKCHIRPTLGSCTFLIYGQNRSIGSIFFTVKNSQ